MISQADEATTNRVKTLKEFCRVKTYPSCASSSSSSSSKGKKAKGQDDDVPDEPAEKFDLLTSLVDCADPVQVGKKLHEAKTRLLSSQYVADTSLT